MSHKIHIALKWGLLGGISTALLGLVLYLLNVERASWLNYVVFGLLIGVIIMGTYEYRDSVLEGFANFKKLLGIGLLIALVFGIVNALWGVYYMEFLNPTLLNDLMLDTEISMEEQGISDEQIKQTLNVMKTMMKPHFFFVTSLLNMLLVGLFGSSLTSLVMRKEKPEELIIDEKLSE